MFRWVRPNITLASSTALLSRAGRSGLSHAGSATHWLLRRAMFSAVSMPMLFQMITDCPYRTGVIEFVKLELANGRSQSSVPVAASTPTTFICVIVTTWRTPPNSPTMGEP